MSDWVFNLFNGYNSILSFVYNKFVNEFSYYYYLFLSFVMLLFLCYRIPYCYSPMLFSVILLIFIFGMFVSLFFCRLLNEMDIFFASFIPVGTPIYICFLVCIAESISYIIRPFVLILRPFINISLGCIGAVSLCSMCFYNWLWLFVLFILFLYEVFVAVVHWYIIVSILLFSIDH